MLATWKPYRYWLIAHVCSQLGVRFATIALPIIALREAGASATEMGIITAGTGIAYIALSLPVGARIEGMPKRRVVAWSGRLRMVACAAMFIVLSEGRLSITAVVVFTLVVGACTVVYDIGLTSGLPERVPNDRLLDANRGFELVQQMTTFLGPALAAGAVWIGPVKWVVLCEGALFGCASIAASRSQPLKHAKPVSEESVSTRLKMGLRYCWGQKAVRQILITIFVSSYSATVILTLQPILVLDILHGNSLDLALCLIAGAAGGLLGANRAKRVINMIGRRPTLVGGLLGAAFCTGGIALAAVLEGAVADRALIIVCAVSQFGIVFCIVHFNIVQATVRQEVTPADYLARMSSVSKLMIWGSAPIASITGGIAADSWGVASVMSVAFVAALLTAVPVLRIDVHPSKAVAT
jgi:Na+/melibiose symporter-like transporter